MAELGKNEIDIIFESMYDGMIAVNSSGIVTLFNKAAGRITGCNAKDVLGKPAVGVIPNTRLHIVIEEGVTEIGQEQNLGNIVPSIIDDPAIFREIEEALRKVGYAYKK